MRERYVPEGLDTPIYRRTLREQEAGVPLLKKEGISEWLSKVFVLGGMPAVAFLAASCSGQIPLVTQLPDGFGGNIEGVAQPVRQEKKLIGTTLYCQNPEGGKGSWEVCAKSDVFYQKVRVEGKLQVALVNSQGVVEWSPPAEWGWTLWPDDENPEGSPVDIIDDDVYRVRFKYSKPTEGGAEGGMYIMKRSPEGQWSFDAGKSKK